MVASKAIFSARDLPFLNSDDRERLVAEDRGAFYNRRRIEISNLPESCNSEQGLHERVLGGFEVLDVAVFPEECRAEVLFPSPEVTKGALEAISQLEIDGAVLEAGFSDGGCMLYIGNVPYNFNLAEFSKLAQTFGGIERTFLARSEITGLCKGYGFVEYLNKEIAGGAKSRFPKELEGKNVRVDFVPMNFMEYEDMHSSTLLVEKFPGGTDSGKLRELFGKHGVVTFCQIPVYIHSGKPKPYCLVDMKSHESAEQAWRALDGMDFHGQRLQVSFCIPGRPAAANMSAVRPQSRFDSDHPMNPGRGMRPFPRHPGRGGPDMRPRMGMHPRMPPRFGGPPGPRMGPGGPRMGPGGPRMGFGGPRGPPRGPHGPRGPPRGPAPYHPRHGPPHGMEEPFGDEGPIRDGPRPLMDVPLAEPREPGMRFGPPGKRFPGPGPGPRGEPGMFPRRGPNPEFEGMRPGGPSRMGGPRGFPPGRGRGDWGMEPRFGFRGGPPPPQRPDNFQQRPDNFQQQREGYPEGNMKEGPDFQGAGGPYPGQDAPPRDRPERRFGPDKQSSQGGDQRYGKGNFNSGPPADGFRNQEQPWQRPEGPPQQGGNQAYSSQSFSSPQQQQQQQQSQHQQQQPHQQGNQAPYQQQQQQQQPPPYHSQDMGMSQQRQQQQQQQPPPSANQMPPSHAPPGPSYSHQSQAGGMAPQQMQQSYASSMPPAIDMNAPMQSGTANTASSWNSPAMQQADPNQYGSATASSTNVTQSAVQQPDANAYPSTMATGAAGDANAQYAAQATSQAGQYSQYYQQAAATQGSTANAAAVNPMAAYAQQFYQQYYQNTPPPPPPMGTAQAYPGVWQDPATAAAAAAQGTTQAAGGAPAQAAATPIAATPAADTAQQYPWMQQAVATPASSYSQPTAASSAALAVQNYWTQPQQAGQTAAVASTVASAVTVASSAATPYQVYGTSQQQYATTTPAAAGAAAAAWTQSAQANWANAAATAQWYQQAQAAVSSQQAVGQTAQQPQVAAYQQATAYQQPTYQMAATPQQQTYATSQGTTIDYSQQAAQYAAAAPVAQTAASSQMPAGEKRSLANTQDGSYYDQGKRGRF